MLTRENPSRKRAGAAEHRGRRTVHRWHADGRGRQENAREAEVATQAAYTSAEHPGRPVGTAVGSSMTIRTPTMMRLLPASTPAKLRSKAKLPAELTPALTAIIVRASPVAVALVLPRVAIGGVVTSSSPVNRAGAP